MTSVEHLPVNSPGISGRKVVVAMFAFGICATTLLYVYWTLHLMPFMPLQEAIVAEFPDSAPRVDGGQKKMHRNTPTILRIVMKTRVDPTALDEESTEAISAICQRIAELSKQKVQLPNLDFIELHIYKLLQEQEIRTKSFRLDIRAGIEWQEVDAKGSPLTTTTGPGIPPTSETPRSTPATSGEPVP